MQSRIIDEKQGDRAEPEGDVAPAREPVKTRLGQGDHPVWDERKDERKDAETGPDSRHRSKIAPLIVRPVRADPDIETHHRRLAPKT